MDAWNQGRQRIWDHLDCCHDLMEKSSAAKEWDIMSETSKLMIEKAEKMISICFDFPVRPYPPPCGQSQEELIREAMLDNSLALVYVAKGHLGFAYADIKRYGHDDNYDSPMQTKMRIAVETAKKCMASMSNPFDQETMKKILDTHIIDTILVD